MSLENKIEVSDKRITKRYNFKTKNWDEIFFTQIKEGDLFRLYEPTGEIVMQNGKFFVWAAEGDAFVDEKTDEYAVDGTGVRWED